MPDKAKFYLGYLGTEKQQYLNHCFNELLHTAVYIENSQILYNAVLKRSISQCSTELLSSH